MQRLKHKILFLAGGGGIGDVIAARYASEGATVVLGDRNYEGAKATVDGLKAQGHEALAVELDGSDQASVSAAVKLACDTYGGLDGFHANFASFADGKFDGGALEIPLAAYDEMMHINARGFLLCTKAALPALIARGGGAMIYTSSGAAHAGEPIRVAYAMSKAAIHALMRNVASRYGAKHVRANVIAPGIILHGALAAKTSDAFKESALKRIAIKTRLGRSEDIAGVSAMLMSDDGAYITGQVISVDGGSSMRS